MGFPAGRNYFCFDLPDYDSDDSFGPKFSENMDLIDLFIGSEGIFCIITEADIYLSSDVKESEVIECGKTTNGMIKERYGQEAEDAVKRIKSILDTNYILNIGNLL